MEAFLTTNTRSASWRLGCSSSGTASILLRDASPVATLLLLSTPPEWYIRLQSYGRIRCLEKHQYPVLSMGLKVLAPDGKAPADKAEALRVE